MPNDGTPAPTKDFIARRIPGDVHLKARQRALTEDVSLNTVVIRLLAYYAEFGLPPAPAQKG